MIRIWVGGTLQKLLFSGVKGGWFRVRVLPSHPGPASDASPCPPPTHTLPRGVGVRLWRESRQVTAPAAPPQLGFPCKAGRGPGKGTGLLWPRRLHPQCWREGMWHLCPLTGSQQEAGRPGDLCAENTWSWLGAGVTPDESFPKSSQFAQISP